MSDEGKAPPRTALDGMVARGFAAGSPNCPDCGAPPSKQVVRQWGVYPGDADVYCDECGAYVRAWNSG